MIKIKMGHLPGDVSRKTKIDMMEGKYPDKKVSKAFKKLVRMKEKALLKERLRKEIKEQLGS